MKTEASNIILESNLKKASTSHWLHLIVSLVTFGLWIPVWILVSISNNIARNKLINKAGAV